MQRALRGASLAAALVATLACERRGTDEKNEMQAPKQPASATADAREGHLRARPARPIHPAPIGSSRLGLAPLRDGRLHVPKSYRPDRPAPLVVFFHGAGGDAGQGDMLVPLAEELGFVLLATDSRASTWDVVRSEFGPDVAFLDRALAHVFERIAIDETRVVASGFSDGASYALSLGVTSGDLFDAIAAFSPGFAAPGELHGRPRVFVSHGDQDSVLPIDACSRRLVPRLRKAGYDVTYDEFAGPHTVPASIAARAMRWALAT